ncbi:MAG: cyclic nucleotide-binding domain-containing protein [Spirochaetota bacterium]|nr:cyclic nucleotide-binding domain-containing protein [Spirochaetota bacterium]
MPKKIMYFQKGERIIREGRLDKRMYIILEGNVKISLSDGDESIIVANLKRGDFFGEMSLFNNTPRSATATADGDVKLAYIDNIKQLKAFLMVNPTFAAKMVHILALRLARTNEILVNEFKELNKYKFMRDVSGLHYFVD